MMNKCHTNNDRLGCIILKLLFQNLRLKGLFQLSRQ